MPQPTVVIVDDFPPVLGPSEAYKSLLVRASVEYYDTLPESDDELLGRIGHAECAINIRSSVKFTRGILSQCDRLKVISLWGTGTDHVDLAAAAELGVTVTNTPGVSAYTMAEHALTLMLAVARQIPKLDTETRKGRWPRGFVTQLHGKTLGVIGLGAIGAQMARLGRGIGMRVVSWTMHPSPERAQELGVESVDLDELYRESDVVSLHLRQSPDTVGFIGEKELSMMKPTAIFINTARGRIVDEAALIAALREGRIAGAGLDVFADEPLPQDHPLGDLENVVATPHSGGVTKEALEAGLELSIENVFDFLSGEPSNVVTAPAPGAE